MHHSENGLDSPYDIPHGWDTFVDSHTSDTNNATILANPRPDLVDICDGGPPPKRRKYNPSTPRNLGKSTAEKRLTHCEWKYMSKIHDSQGNYLPDPLEWKQRMRRSLFNISEAELASRYLLIQDPQKFFFVSRAYNYGDIPHQFTATGSPCDTPVRLMAYGLDPDTTNPNLYPQDHFGHYMHTVTTNIFRAASQKLLEWQENMRVKISIVDEMGKVSFESPLKTTFELVAKAFTNRRSIMGHHSTYVFFIDEYAAAENATLLDLGLQMYTENTIRAMKYDQAKEILDEQVVKISTYLNGEAGYVFHIKRKHPLDEVVATVQRWSAIRNPTDTVTGYWPGPEVPQIFPGQSCTDLGIHVASAAELWFVTGDLESH